MARKSTNIVEHRDTSDGVPPVVEFMDRHHPANDTYMVALEQTKRNLMAQRNLLRPKQVNILKSVFQGHNYTDTAAIHGCAPQTVSNLTRSDKGSRLLGLLQYHQQLLEGPQEMQRRSALWRMAVDNEKLDPTIAIKAITELNKMADKEWEKKNPTATDPNHGTVNNIQINIDQKLLPKGALDG